MPYTIETYKGTRLVNIETDKQFDTKAECEAKIAELYIEQNDLNKEIDQMYLDELQVSLMDQDTNDRIPRKLPYYMYSYKPAKYSKRAISKMA